MVGFYFYKLTDTSFLFCYAYSGGVRLFASVFPVASLSGQSDDSAGVSNYTSVSLSLAELLFYGLFIAAGRSDKTVDCRQLSEELSIDI